MSTVSVRYIVDDVDQANEFYDRAPRVPLDMHPDPAFAMLSRGDLRLVLVSPVPDRTTLGGGSRPMPDGTPQQPGGWNRFMLQVPDVGSPREQPSARTGCNSVPTSSPGSGPNRP